MKFPFCALLIALALTAAAADPSTPSTTIGQPTQPIAMAGKVDNTSVPNTTVVNGKRVKLKTTADGLKYYDIRLGTGAKAHAGQTVTVNYVGTLLDGTKFDSSYDRHQPFSFQLGAGQVIPGWDEGVAGMKVGGKRRLVVPGKLAYGPSSPTPAIPPNATLVFDVELLDAK